MFPANIHISWDVSLVAAKVRRRNEGRARVWDGHCAEDWVSARGDREERQNVTVVGLVTLAVRFSADGETLNGLPSSLSQMLEVVDGKFQSPVGSQHFEGTCGVSGLPLASSGRRIGWPSQGFWDRGSGVPSPLLERFTGRQSCCGQLRTVPRTREGN